MGRSDFKNLRVYQLAEDLADTIWDSVTTWDRFAKSTVGQQIVRAADSVGANIAEGRGRRDYKDNKRFVRIAWGSLNETQHFLRRAYKRKLIRDKQVEELKLLVDELAPSLNAYHRSITSHKS
ncbi:four helix bundle protein [Verrucomicrobiota bacterium]